MNKELKQKLAAQIRANLEEQGIDKEASMAALGRLWSATKKVPGRMWGGIKNVGDDIMFGVGRRPGRRGGIGPQPMPGTRGGAGTPNVDADGVLSMGGHTAGTAFGKALALGAGLGLAGVAIGAGGAAAQSGYKGIKDPLMRGVGFKRMMREEDNQWMQNESKSKLKKLHKTLYRFSPKMALDPLVAGAFMKKQLEFEDVGIQPNDLSTIANIEKAVADAGSKELMTQAFSGSGISGLGGLL